VEPQEVSRAAGRCQGGRLQTPRRRWEARLAEGWAQLSAWQRQVEPGVRPRAARGREGVREKMGLSRPAHHSVSH